MYKNPHNNSFWAKEVEQVKKDCSVSFGTYMKSTTKEIQLYHIIYEVLHDRRVKKFGRARLRTDFR